MKLAPFFAFLVLLGACATPRKNAAAVPAALSPNFILVVSESVPNPIDDGLSFTKVFVDGKEVGRTGVGRKSEDRALQLKLPAGNEPVRLEHWILTGVGAWARLDDALQPRERFVRVEDGAIVRLEVRFSGGEAANVVTTSREPAEK